MPWNSLRFISLAACIDSVNDWTYTARFSPQVACTVGVCCLHFLPSSLFIVPEYSPQCLTFVLYIQCCLYIEKIISRASQNIFVIVKNMVIEDEIVSLMV